MPTFDLKHIRAAKYNHDNGTTSYTGGVEVGDAISVDLNLRFAEGRLYAESSLAEYLTNATGGTASLAVKYIKDAAQKLMYGMRNGSRTVNGKTVTSLKYGANDTGDYVGFAFYAPDMIDTVKKFTCVLVNRARFAPPAMQYRTKGENYEFHTPTTTGEFLPDLGDDKDLFEVAVVDDEETAAAWVDAAVNYSSSKAAKVSAASVQRVSPLMELNTATPDADLESPNGETEEHPVETDSEKTDEKADETTLEVTDA